MIIHPFLSKHIKYKTRHHEILICCFLPGGPLGLELVDPPVDGLLPPKILLSSGACWSMNRFLLLNDCPVPMDGKGENEGCGTRPPEELPDELKPRP